MPEASSSSVGISFDRPPLNYTVYYDANDFCAIQIEPSTLPLGPYTFLASVPTESGRTPHKLEPVSIEQPPGSVRWILDPALIAKIGSTVTITVICRMYHKCRPIRIWAMTCNIELGMKHEILVRVSIGDIQADQVWALAQLASHLYAQLRSSGTIRPNTPVGRAAASAEADGRSLGDTISDPVSSDSVTDAQDDGPSCGENDGGDKEGLEEEDLGEEDLGEGDKLDKEDDLRGQSARELQFRRHKPYVVDGQSPSGGRKRFHLVQHPAPVLGEEDNLVGGGNLVGGEAYVLL
ncbi:uncharacterized protein B0I36DRAFT_417376 [Microdochium trichocladiopsis]|uniref:Uncharacterized protein n=1 Tax=Microdochium trichocladiopsis TaxID=1682393 RepID=A0A9P8XZ69_9PEZI|nr:uncharacterized protein B0I36DRAFT_417376 [Microdochium trichocladiopsis]KAH7025234.1 hypothetical protein B0I36DRAFT_417376 [Microdochium trichocladiopsis]